jgi:DNA-binding phage protein
MTVSALSSTSQVAPTSSDPASSARSNVMSAVANELGISQSDLQTQLRSGKSLSDVAAAAGISSDQLTATITTALQKSNLPAGTDVAALATQMATRVGGHHHHHQAAATSDPTSTSSTSDLVSALTGGSASAVDTYL